MKGLPVSLHDSPTQVVNNCVHQVITAYRKVQLIAMVSQRCLSNIKLSGMGGLNVGHRPYLRAKPGMMWYFETTRLSIGFQFSKGHACNHSALGDTPTITAPPYYGDCSPVLLPSPSHIRSASAEIVLLVPPVNTLARKWVAGM